MGCLHTNYTKNSTLENSQIQQGINKKESNHTTITFNDTELHSPNLTLKRFLVTEESHYWTNVQNCTRFTALTLATAPLTEKTQDLNLPQQLILVLRLVGPFSARSGQLTLS
jgi:hypothetical protein